MKLILLCHPLSNGINNCILASKKNLIAIPIILYLLSTMEHLLFMPVNIRNSAT